MMVAIRCSPGLRRASPRQDRRHGLQQQLHVAAQRAASGRTCTSMRTQSAKETVDRPRTCQMHVRPGVTSSRWRSQPRQASVSSQGKRPRPHQRHLAAQHVPQLRQLVDAGAPQESPQARRPRVVLDLERRPVLFVQRRQLRFAGLGVDDHRAELQHHELPPAQSAPLLTKEHRPRRGGLDRRGHQRQQRRQQQQAQRRRRPRRSAASKPAAGE